jgi:hypothetical protein
MNCNRCVGLKKVLIAILTILVLAVPMVVGALSVAPPLHSENQGQALLISSLNETLPMGYYEKDLLYYLKRDGYNITYLADGAVTVDFLLHNLNNYSVVIWRTNTFNWVHTTYWYIGERNNEGIEQEYPAEFAAGFLNDHTGIVGASEDFFYAHFKPNSLSDVKVLVLAASEGNSIAPFFITAGVSSVIFCNGAVSLQFGLIDDLTVQIISYLTQGQNVYNAVYDTVSPFNQGQQLEDNLDTPYAPPFWFIGNATLTLTSGPSTAGVIAQ